MEACMTGRKFHPSERPRLIARLAGLNREYRKMHEATGESQPTFAQMAAKEGEISAMAELLDLSPLAAMRVR